MRGSEVPPDMAVMLALCLGCVERLATTTIDKAARWTDGVLGTGEDLLIVENQELRRLAPNHSHTCIVYRATLACTRFLTDLLALFDRSLQICHQVVQGDITK